MMDTARIRSALSHIPPYDRDLWVRMGMAVKSELGPDGFDLWDNWSQRADSYKPRDARAVWRSIKGGAITIASLFHEATQHGWHDDAPMQADTAADRELRRQARAAAASDEAARRERQAAQAITARDLLAECAVEPHIYLDRKGFKADAYGGRGLVHPSGDLLIPMRDWQSNSLWNVQRIAPDGSKKFLPGGRAKGMVHFLGQGNEHWLCEGYATGLSVLLAVRSLHRKYKVVVCFSAGNLVHVAGLLRGRRIVVADHDVSGTGQQAAEKTGLPWVMSATLGDANDLHQAQGLRALAALLRRGLQI